MIELATLALILSISWAAGISAFTCLITLSLFELFGISNLSNELNFLQNPYLISIIAILFVTEFIIDKISGLDSALDSFQLFIKIPTVGFLCFLLSANLSLFYQILAFIIVVFITSISHAVKASIRIFINTSEENYNNWIFSIIENIFVFMLIITSIKNKNLFFILFSVYIVFGFWFLPKIFGGIKNIFQVVFGIFTGYKRR